MSSVFLSPSWVSSSVPSSVRGGALLLATGAGVASFYKKRSGGYILHFEVLIQMSYSATK
ncbi:MAG: hypothetical protein WA421_07275 [Nitrososphaeraceae archaeon]